MLSVSLSGFYDFLQRALRPDRGAPLRRERLREYTASHCTYGRPRLHAVLRKKHPTVGDKRIARWMRELAIQGLCKGRRRPKGRLHLSSLPAAPNLLQRQFDVHHQHPALATDLTYLATKEGWMYLAVVMDLRTGQIIGYCLDHTMTMDLVCTALRTALRCSRIFDP